MQTVHEFVITGGPCAGKSTCLSILEQTLTKRGYKVIVVAETATELINSGVSPGNIPNHEFQQLVLKRSLNKEETLRDIVRFFDKDVIILYDRGILDSKAYMALDDFALLLKAQGLSEVSARDRYDAVFHLVTAAEGAEQFYTLENNKARLETPKQARELDHKTKQAWIGHPHLRVIDNSTDFETKVSKLCAEVLSVLGLPLPIEIERKYLIRRPSEEFLKQIGAVKQNIIQAYLFSSDKTVEKRLRQRGTAGDYSYFYTEKIDHSTLGRIEKEKKITEKEYLSQLMNIKKIIRKDRYCFVYNSQYFELDIYPDWDNEQAILEIELTKECQIPDMPSWVEIIKEVTQDKNFRNVNLAQTQTNQ